MAFTNVWKHGGFRIFLRPSNVDFDNAINTYPSFVVHPGDDRTIQISKVNLMSISSEDNPCIEEDIPIEESCIYKIGEERFIAKYDCKLPWMKDESTALCPIIEAKNGPNGTISYEAISEKVKYWIDQTMSRIGRENICPSGTKCKSTLYKVRTEITNDELLKQQAKVVIKLESPIVQNVVDSYAYDLQSLIGEVGGTLGLFLGLSTYSFIEFLTYLIEKLSCIQD